MKTTKRFDNAVTKLYNAFHENKLNAMDCQACAVGNIFDNSGDWDLLGTFQSVKKYATWYVASEENKEEALKVIQKSGYSAEELEKIEIIFLESCKYKKGSKEEQFKGLCAIIQYLCELDNLPNVMDYTKLFETENDKPKYQLS